MKKRQSAYLRNAVRETLRYRPAKGPYKARLQWALDFAEDMYLRGYENACLDIENACLDIKAEVAERLEKNRYAT